MEFPVDSRRLPVTSVAAALVLAGCASTTPLTKAAANALISPQEEIALGQQLTQRVEQKYHPLPDPAVQAYVEQLGQRVAAPSAGQRVVPVHFIVLDAPDQVNAFAIPGGNIFVYSGLLASVPDEAALAGVLAHEVGHVTERHAAQRIVTQFGIEALEQAAFGRNPGVLEQLAAQIGAEGILLKNSRTDETQADADAVKALAATGYNPLGLAQFFQTLESDGAQPAQFLSDHPSPANRVSAIETEAAQLHATSGITSSPQFATMQSDLRSYYASRGVRIG